MAKKEITGYINLQINAGAANPSPPVGPALGQKLKSNVLTIKHEGDVTKVCL